MNTRTSLISKLPAILIGLVSVNLCNAQWSTGSGKIFAIDSAVAVGTSVTSSGKVTINKTGSTSNLVLTSDDNYNSPDNFSHLDFEGVTSSGTKTVYGRLRTEKANGTSGDLKSRVALTGHNGSGFYDFLNYFGDDDKVYLSTANTARLTVTGAGLIGVGTTSPAEPLDIVGNARVSKDDGYLILNRSATSKYLGVSHRTNSVAKWFVGLRENLTSDNYIIYNEANGTDVMTLDVSSSNAWFAGNVGIGTTTSSEKLSVNGNIIARKVKVTQTGWPDYVFKDTYALSPLTEVEAYIKTHGHLRGIPAAAIVEKEGHDLGEMDKLLLQMVEELTLYVIALEKQLNQLKAERGVQGQNKTKLRTSGEH